jgi:hypothetical protein
MTDDTNANGTDDETVADESGDETVADKSDETVADTSGDETVAWSADETVADKPGDEPVAESGDETVAETATAPAAAAPVATDAKLPPDKGKRWQRITSVVLLVVGFILVPLSAVAIWSHNQLTNTDRYVETVSPLAGNADVQHTVANVVVDAIFNNTDVLKRVEKALPKKAQFLGEPIANAARSYALEVTQKLLASDQFQELWDAANRRAHTQLVALLTDDPGKAPGSVSVKDGQVSLDLAKVVTKVQGKLVDAGLTFLENVKVPPVSTTIAIINTEGLAEAQSYVSLLDTLAWVLPVLGILALIGSALVVPRRRRATIRAAIVLVAACMLTLVLLAVARSLYLDAATTPKVSAGTASAVFDILVRNLRYGVITLGVVGIIIALVAYFVGPSAPAKMARRFADKGIAGARNKAGDLGYQPNAFEVFVGAHKRALEMAIAGLAVVALVLWDRPTIGVVLFLLVVALILVGVVEFLARGSVPETVDEVSV